MRRRTRPTRHPAAVNLTPLLDTVFLVVVLLLCALLHMRVVPALEVAPPAVAGASALDNRRVLTVSVARDGTVRLEGEALGAADLAGRLAGRGPGADACLVSADRAARHGAVTDVLVAVKAALGETPTYFEVASPTE